MSSFYISAAHKSSGKTTLSVGICAALSARGLKVQTFKKGPDYIDPMWLARASGNDCHNLDFFTTSEAYIQQQYQQFSTNRDAVLVEGNKGLYDGISMDGSDSNAAMAKLLQLPVVLVLDTTGTTRGVAPLLKGYQAFDEEISIAGVILNKVGGPRHEGKLRQIIEHYTDLEIFGVVGRNADLELDERHLGLIPSYEMENNKADSVVRQLGDRVNQDVDLDRLLSLTPQFPRQNQQKFSSGNQISTESSLRIAIARDSAFGFYYPGDLQRFRALGAELIPFDTMRDSALPENIHGLFIGGGFPETHLHLLAQNDSLKNDIKKQIQQGLPAYAECGGLMYLCDSIEYEDSYNMVGLINASVTMHSRPQGRGYVKLESSANHPWLSSESPPFKQIKAHEFHYSRLKGLPIATRFAYKLTRGAGINGQNDGIILHNLLASYTHLRQTDQCTWIDSFVSFVRNKLNTSL